MPIKDEQTPNLPWPERYHPDILKNSDLLSTPGSYSRLLIQKPLLMHLAAEQGLSMTQLITLAVLKVYGSDLKRIAQGTIKPTVRAKK